MNKRKKRMKSLLVLALGVALMSALVPMNASAKVLKPRTGFEPPGLGYTLPVQPPMIRLPFDLGLR